MSSSPKKVRLLILFGGRSAEHDVSILSACNVMRALAPERYDPLPVFITRQGRWLLSSFDGATLATPDHGTEVSLRPGGEGELIALSQKGHLQDIAPVDLMFPVLHGLPGEDGSVQGLAEVAMVPLVGCGIAGSANALDKVIAKRLFNEAGLTTAASLAVHRHAVPTFSEVEAALGLPVFVKPARQGSSIGVSCVANETDYKAAIETGFRYDRDLLLEESIKGREIECAVLENPDGTLFASHPGEIVPTGGHSFYDYEAKYLDEKGSVLSVPAELSEEIEAKVRDMAQRAFRALGCDAMARADFFVTPEGRVLVNELNTIPGFTDISMYSKVMAASGVPYPELLDRLIQQAVSRANHAA